MLPVNFQLAGFNILVAMYVCCSVCAIARDPELHGLLVKESIAKIAKLRNPFFTESAPRPIQSISCNVCLCVCLISETALLDGLETSGHKWY